jgi:hypothetical protein
MTLGGKYTFDCIKSNIENSTTLFSDSSSKNNNPIDNNNGSGNNPEQTTGDYSASASVPVSTSNTPTVPTNIPVVNATPVYGVPVPQISTSQVPVIPESSNMGAERNIAKEREIEEQREILREIEIEREREKQREIDNNEVCSDIHTSDDEETTQQKIAILLKQQEQENSSTYSVISNEIHPTDSKKIIKEKLELQKLDQDLKQDKKDIELAIELNYIDK